MDENENTCPTCGLSAKYLTGVRKTADALDLALESLGMIAVEDVGSAAAEAEDALRKINGIMVGNIKAAHRVPSPEL